MSKREYEPGTLGRWMEDRRGELGMTWDEVAAIADVSAETLRRNAADPTGKKGIERALRWENGSVDEIIGGDAPTEKQIRTGRSQPRHEWSARQRAKILAMSFEDALDLAEQIYAGTRDEETAWTWLHEAARLKVETFQTTARRGNSLSN